MYSCHVSDISKQELVVALAGLAIRYESNFVDVATKLINEESGGFPMSAKSASPVMILSIQTDRSGQTM